MNKEYGRIFYYFITGAIGGLFGWYLCSIFFGAADKQDVLQQSLYGAVLGMLIGISIAGYDSLISGSFIRFLKFGGIGLLLGSIGGAIALPLSIWFYSSVSTFEPQDAPLSSILIGEFCWILFGGIIGLIEGLTKGTQSWKGFLGGMIGGFAGGLLYEINRAFNISSDSNFGKLIILAVSFTLLGGAIGASIAFVTSALKQAWIEVLNGKFEGRTYDVTKYVDPKLGAHRSGVIGSDQWSSNIYLPGDSEVLPRHAEISYTNGAPMLTASPEASKRPSTFVNGRRVTTSPLSNGDKLQIGATQIIYYQKKK